MFGGTRGLIPLLQFLNDFSEVLISDDKYDIGKFSSPSHPSVVHHYQWGTLIKGLTDTAIQLITFSSRMLESRIASTIAKSDKKNDGRSRDAKKSRQGKKG